MTRETKIGLLVGLAFIIVIGILLSDHIGSTTEPISAAITDVGPRVRQGVQAPDAQPSGRTTIVTPAPVVPKELVATQKDPPSAANPGISIVNVPAGQDPAAAVAGTRPQDPSPDSPDSNIQIAPGNGAVARNDQRGANSPNPPAGMTTLLNDHKDELEPVGPPVGVQHPNPAPPVGPTQPGVPPGYRQIKAEEKDTVTKLAIKYLGANSKANREAIIKANPSMGADGHLVIVGRTYLVPAAAAPLVGTGPQPIAQTLTPPAPAPLARSANWYTVKDSDSLWKIASEQLGAGARWTEIRDLNKDVLKGTEQLHASMRLRMPRRSNAEG